MKHRNKKVSIKRLLNISLYLETHSQFLQSVSYLKWSMDH